MGIREEREAQAAKFVCVRDLLEGLATTESTTIGEVAGYLLGKLSKDSPPRFVRRDAQSLMYYKEDAEQAYKLLRHVSHWEAFEDNLGSYSEISSDDFDNHGWFREEMAEFIKGLNIDTPPCCFTLWRPEPKRPAWFKAYENRIRLSLDEAVSILAKTDPTEECPYGPNDCDEYREMRRYRLQLEDAIDNGHWGFEATTWGMNRGEQTLSHSGIKAWALDTGAPWPFLDDAKAPTPESPEGRAMASELKAAKARIVHLEQELKVATTSESHSAYGDLVMTRPVKLVALVQKEFWETYDPDAPGAKLPTQSIIIEWLEKVHKLSNFEAKAVEKIACPFDRDPSKRSWGKI